MTTTPPVRPIEPQLQLDQRLCFSLYAASLAATQAYKPMLSELGLTYPQFLVLMVLWEEGHSTIGHLASRLFQAPAAMTPMVKRLEQAGLVQRERDVRDERSVQVSVTPAGEALRERAAVVSDRFALRCGMSGDQAIELREQLNQLGRQLREAPEA